MNKKKNILKSVRETVKELRKTDRGKGLLFLGIYFVFFLFLFLFINFGSRNIILSEDFELNFPDTYSVDKILNANYRFVYNIYIDDRVLTYNGKKIDNEELFSFDSVDYYHNDDNYFAKHNGQWSISTNPYIFKEFLDFERLGEVIVDATYISKTEFDSGKTLFNYQVSSNSLIKRIEGVDTDIMEVPNNIIFSTDRDSYLNKIELELSSYGKFRGICIDNFKITLEYFDFGEIEEIVSPIL